MVVHGRNVFGLVDHVRKLGLLRLEMRRHCQARRRGRRRGASSEKGARIDTKMPRLCDRENEKDTKPVEKRLQQVARGEQRCKTNATTKLLLRHMCCKEHTRVESIMDDTLVAIAMAAAAAEDEAAAADGEVMWNAESPVAPVGVEATVRSNGDADAKAAEPESTSDKWFRGCCECCCCCGWWCMWCCWNMWCNRGEASTGVTDEG
jgi:hypothetical protein